MRMTGTEITDLYNTQNTASIGPNPVVFNMPVSGDLEDVSQFKNHGQPADAALNLRPFWLSTKCNCCES